MPTYEYRCSECRGNYEVFHKVRENPEDVVCPSCGSHAHTRKMSVTGLSMTGYSSSGSSITGSSDSCGSGSCCGSACSMN